ncbi:hypothetical protein AVEN_196432-1 [Araneus ventricosus]|uniref:Uncharacterized protein n=1 Tax=Araneus ventricosus TaxID=182803 RepID=A0A4Y2AV50_ARAVE|nr:hypothetical protein AVEN_196432-1 [Araneus ventricosus]
MTLSYYFTKPSSENTQLWWKSVLSNKLSRINITKLVSFLTENENLIKQPPDATSSDVSDPDFSPSPRPQTYGLRPSRDSIPRTLISAPTMKQYLVEVFGEQISGYGGFQEWPPRSPDLTPMDFFPWGYLKQQVYATPPPPLQDLQRRITDACADVTPAMLHHVQRKVQARVQMCIVTDGEKFEHRK